METFTDICRRYICHLTILWLCFNLSYGAAGDNITDCSVIYCYNNGAAVYQDNYCVCQCPPGFSGLLCEFEVQQSVWPSGPYVLLLPSTGCPESEAHGWSKGFISFTAQNRLEIMRTFYDSNSVLEKRLSSENETKLAGPFGNYSFQINFCYKHADIEAQDDMVWPAEAMTVFGALDGCPIGFDEGLSTIPLPELRSWWSDGYLPYFKVKTDSEGTKLTMKHCHRNGTDTSSDRHWIKPFILPKKYDDKCSTGLPNNIVTDETLTLYGTSVNGSLEEEPYGSLSFCSITPRVKEVIKVESRWPNGPFAILKHASGCPESDKQGWRVGYINFTTVYTVILTTPWTFDYQLLQEEDYPNTTFLLHFCYKMYMQSANDTINWPDGDYGIFGAENGCPKGFTEEIKTIELPAILSWSKVGHLPYFHISSGKTSELTTKYCQRDETNKELNKVNWLESFIWMNNEKTSCDIIDGFYGYEETLNLTEITDDGAMAAIFNMPLCNYIAFEETGCYTDEEYYCEGYCYSRRLLCDGEERCTRTGFDEIEDNCAHYKCPKHELYCDFGKCIPAIWICDKFRHCQDGTDELQSNCYLRNYTSRECYDSEFKCGDGNCIPKSRVCDDVRNCADGRDEFLDQCALRCGRAGFNCDENTWCYNREHLCDGFYVCKDGFDEDVANCALKCERNEYYCGDGSCIGREELCDGVKHCADGRDEKEENCASKCLVDEFYCDNGRCISSVLLCDGVAHCEDQADENCNEEPVTPLSFPSDLGLTDGSISDRRISASSCMDTNPPKMVRPFLNSWCPRSDDSAPFVEIDFVSVGVIVGIAIFNSLKETYIITNNVNNLYVELSGSRSFSISYALYPERVIPYNDEPFYIDTSLEINIPQKFTFLRPFMARYVRILPLLPIHSGSRCLRMELIGSLVIESKLNQNRTYSGYTTEVGVNETGFETITSPGFPLNYRADRTFRWSINMENGGYVRVTIAFLNLYNEKDDELIIGNFKPITALHNGFTPTFPTDISKVLVTFITYRRRYHESKDKMGFRLIVKREDFPTVWHTIGDRRIQQGYIIAHSFLGIIVLPQRHTWHLKSYVNGGPLILNIQQFNIPCNTDTQMSIKERSGDRQYYCSPNNKPSAEHKSWDLIIDLMYTNKQTIDGPEGFSAHFRRLPLLSTYQQFVSFEHTYLSKTPERGDTHEVCSTIFKKCYNYTQKSEFLDWHTERKSCLNDGANLVVIHTRTELQFLQSWLFYITNTYRWWSKYYSMYANNMFYTHIGLMYIGNTTNKYIWQDGTTLTFSAWDDAEPTDINNRPCTGMWINIDAKGAWRTSLCNEKMTPTFQYASVCEKPVQPVANSSIFSDSANVNGDRNTAALFLCHSGEWTNQHTVCDGIKDCLDSSDEWGCPLTQLGICVEDEFRCDDGDCIQMEDVCNYVDDCKDKSDEYCSFPQCHGGEFRCSNKQCVPNYVRCDAVEDCLDGSDERQCVSCNETVSFSCGDLICIHRLLVCNGVQDCEDGRDETCDRQYSTCMEYWRSGLNNDVNGNIEITTADEDSLKCQFQRTSPSSIEVTSTLEKEETVHRLSMFKTSKTYAMDFLDITKHGDICERKILVECAPYISEIAKYADPYFNGTYSYCLPKNITFYFNYNCSRCAVIELPRPAAFDFNAARINRGYKAYYYSIPTSDSYKAFQLTKWPIVCTSEFKVSQDEFICGDGNIEPTDRRCIYDYNRAGVLDGCPNFKHLENCENYTCPSGYDKCPSSFCIATSMICDGEKQCPGGEDEIGCGCENRTSTIAVIYNDAMNTGTRSAILKFARQFYSKDANLYAIRYSFYQDNAFSGGLSNISSEKIRIVRNSIHPYNEVFTTEYLEISSERKGSLIENILRPLLEEEGLINGFIVEHDFTANQIRGDNFINSSIIDHVYYVHVNPNINTRLSLLTSGKTSEVIIKSWHQLANIGSNMFPELCKVSDELRRFYAGRYRCSYSRTSIPLSQVCDGEKNCVFGDDEESCGFYCPPNCSCELYIANCRSTYFTTTDMESLGWKTRMLDMSHNIVDIDGQLFFPKQFPVLVKLLATNCSIHSIADGAFANATKLRHIDLSYNLITTIQRNTFIGLTFLRHLNLSGNSFIENIEPYSFETLQSLPELILTNTMLRELLPNTFSGLNVNILNISNNKIKNIHGLAFNNLTAEIITFNENDVQLFDKKIFSGLKNVSMIVTPAFKFCCYKPATFTCDDICLPHQDYFSSCNDLLESYFLQYVLWVIGVGSVVGNACTIIYRVIYDRSNIRKGHGMFVSNLAAADFLMGAYMIIIAVADVSYRGIYIHHDEYWRHSFWCNFAGVLATLSSEASVLFICLITIDRIRAIKFPFGRWKFTASTSRMAVSITWIISLLISVIPVCVRDYFQGNYYSDNSVCLALPLTQRQTPGWLYSLLANVFLNFVAFMMIATGQLVIFLEIRKASKRMKHARSKRLNDIKIAKSLLLIAATDFFCWFPIGLLAIMTLDGYVISREVYAWTAVLLLPINSALNPYLYTLSAVLRKQKSDVSTSQDQKSSKVQGIMIGTERSIIKDGSAIPMHKSSLETRQVFSTILPIVFGCGSLHKCGYVYGGVAIHKTADGKPQVVFSVPRKSTSKEDRQKDIYDIGRALEQLLNLRQTG